jgi:hypothetical protein
MGNTNGTGNQEGTAVTEKTSRNQWGPAETETPREREEIFEPVIAPKHQRKFRKFDDGILPVYVPRRYDAQNASMFGSERAVRTVDRGKRVVVKRYKRAEKPWRTGCAAAGG